MAKKLVTIERHILEQEKQYPAATGEFTQLLYDISLSAKIISREVNKAGLVNILGSTGKANVQGEIVQKLDEYANDVIRQTMEHTGRLCMMVSEENDEPIPIPEQYPCGKYVLTFDPLDGSSNIDVNVSIGSIFSIYRKQSAGPRGDLTDVLQPGRRMAAAVYVIYGSSTMLVYSTGNGVHGFTLDPSVGEFLLSHPNMRIPEQNNVYSVNTGNYIHWPKPMQQFIDYLQSMENHIGKPYSLRYIGSLVADIHRTLLIGGIFMYPLDYRIPDKPRGKLRLLYEAAPLAFIVEQAGARASDGHHRILDIQPEHIHQRTPLFVGNEKDVLLAEAFLQGKKDK